MVRDGLNLGDELDDLGGLVVGVAVVLVVLSTLADEKNVDVKTIFTCSQTCLLEMKLLVYRRRERGKRRQSP